MLLLILVNLHSERYMENVHKYIFEEGVKLLENYKIYSQYQFDDGQNPIYNKMRYGSWKEDEADWVYGYAYDGPPVIVSGVGNLTEWFIENELMSITHFWDSDNFLPFETIDHDIVSGHSSIDNEYTIHNIPSAVTKAYATIFGQTGHIHTKMFNFQTNEEYTTFQSIIPPVQNNQLRALGGQFKVSIESLEDYEDKQVCIVGYRHLSNYWDEYDQPYHVWLTDEQYNILNNQNPNLEYEYIGRVIHLIADMAVPAHVHNDNHGPYCYDWCTSWSFSNCDQYEGWDFNGPFWEPNGEGGYLRNNLDNVYWDAELALEEYGGLLNIPSDYTDNDFLFDLFYSINQVTDMFASDDIDGDLDEHPDHPFTNYPFIQEMKYKFINEILPEFPDIQSAHEIVDNGEREAIRDFCIPTAIRGVATFLEWYAVNHNFIPIWELPDPVLVSGFVSLDREYDVISVSINFHCEENPENDVTISPGSNGYYQHSFDYNTWGTYDIEFSLNGYYPFNVENQIIDGNDVEIDILLNSILPDYVLVSQNSQVPAFRNIQSAADYLMYNEIDGTIKILPGEYSGDVHWNTDISHITISGTNQENCIINGGLSGFFVEGRNGNENDVIENLTFADVTCAIYSFQNGLNTVRNNKFENCGENIVSIDDNGITNSGTFKLINNEFVNNDCQSCFKLNQESQYPANCSYEINDNVFEDNNTTDPLLFFNGHGQLYINNNTFLNNTYETEDADNGSVIDICLNVDEIISCFIEDNIFQNNDDDMLTDGLISIENDPAWGYYSIRNNSFIENSASSIIFYDANMPSSIIGNTIFLANNVDDWIINGVNIYCNYSIFWQNNNDNWNCSFEEENVFITDPFIDDNYKPIWNNGIKSPCIDVTSVSDPDGTPGDIGAVPAITHKYDIIELPSPETDDGWKWLSFPALDNVYSITDPFYDPDVAEFLLDDILDPNILIHIDAQDYRIQWINPIWDNDWQQFDRTEGFKFLMAEEANLEVPGFKVPDNITIILEENSTYNWVGYWLEETQRAEDAFSDYWDNPNLLSIKAQHWSAARFGDIWLMTKNKGHSATLSYGDMVMILCDQEMSFSWDNSTPEDPKVTFPETKHFSFEEQADYIPLFVEIDPADPPQEIGAKVDGECIGAAVVVDSINQINAYVSGVDPGDIELELYYGDRAEPKILTSYKCVSVNKPDLIGNSISTSGMDSAYFITLREESDLIPQITDISVYNYPNPFNPSTTIAYAIPDDRNVDISIYNIKGQKVKTLVNGVQLAGSYKTVWSGEDTNGNPVSSGIYFYKLSSRAETLIKKIMLLK